MHFLRYTPNASLGGHHAFPLKGVKYRHAWEYKAFIPKGTFRLFYIPDPVRREVLIYYAGAKPRKTPEPPATSKRKPH